MNNKILDISEFQGQINFNKIPNDIAGIIIRGGYGDDLLSQDDKYFEKNYNECRKRHIPCGMYFYTYANTENHLQSEKKHLQRLLKGKNFQLPIYIDFEDIAVTKLSNSKIKYYLSSLLDYIKLLGYSQVGVYASLNIWETKLSSRYYDSWFKWIAQYNTTCDYNRYYNMWQYTSHGRVSGIEGNVDISIIKDNNISIDIDKVLNKYRRGINLVLDGYYGNGNDRKQRVEKDEYNYSVLQGLINEIMK